MFLFIFFYLIIKLFFRPEPTCHISCISFVFILFFYLTRWGLFHVIKGSIHHFQGPPFSLWAWDSILRGCKDHKLVDGWLLHKHHHYYYSYVASRTLSTSSSSWSRSPYKKHIQYLFITTKNIKDTNNSTTWFHKFVGYQINKHSSMCGLHDLSKTQMTT